MKARTSMSPRHMAAIGAIDVERLWREICRCSDARARLTTRYTVKCGSLAVIELTPEPFECETVTAETSSANLKPGEHPQR
jgi:hypothetical protein